MQAQQLGTSLTAWMATTLAMARRANYTVREAALEDALDWIDRMADPETGRVSYQAAGSADPRSSRNDKNATKLGEAMTAAGLWCRLLAGQDPEQVEAIKKHALLLSARLPALESDRFGNEIYYWYFGTYAMFQLGGESWERWNVALQRALVETQIGDGHANGSWDPVGP